ncbi:MAG: CHASE2 domain-containing protein, partial [Burkholderiales bacterium]|nr:CHASE2 domain-containing protein [Burkholderiales bacterium]
MKLPRWFPKYSWNTWVRILAGLTIVFGFLVNEWEIYQYRFIQQMELWAYDTRLRLFLPRTLDPRIVILDIDEKSLNAEGRWPWSRNKVAEMVRQLFERYKVRVVGFDIAFPEADTSSGLASLDDMAKRELKDNAEFQKVLEARRPSLDYDRIFAEELAKWPVVLGFFLGGKTDKAGVLPQPVFQSSAFGNWDIIHNLATGYSGNLPALQEKASAAGHLYPQLDFDGTTRRVPVFMRYADGFYEALSFAIVRTYLGNAPIKLKVLPPQKFSDLAIVPFVDVGDLRVPLDERMSALIPYRGATGSFRYLSATDVVRGTVSADELKDKIVIVGTSAQGLLDLRSTPVREDFPG